jgi:hypothetical protein
MSRPEHPLDLIYWPETGQVCDRRELHYYLEECDDKYKVISWYSKQHPKYGE